MDKLYAIKIKQSDGTYGTAIPVSVLAENVDWNSSLSLVDILGQVDTSESIQDQINNLKNTKATQASVNALDQKIDNAVEYITHDSEIADARNSTDGTEYSTLKERLDTEYSALYQAKIHQFDTVTQMKTNSALSAGMYVCTSGYYNVNDGGAAAYYITSFQPSTYYETLTNGLYARLILKEVVTPEMFGAYGDRATDDTNAIQNALNTGKTVKLLKKSYAIGSTINIPHDAEICGVGIASILYVKTDFNGTTILYGDTNVTHFNLHDFAIFANDNEVRGITFDKPYNSCVIRNVVISDIPKAAIYIGIVDGDLSQTLLIDNCYASASDTVTSTESLLILNRCYEANISNSKFLFRQNNISNYPCVTLNKCWTYYIRGNSFASTSQEAIQFNGSTRYGRIIANTYENIGVTLSATGTQPNGYLLRFIGTLSDDVIHNLVIEETYYNTAAAIDLTYSRYNTFVGPFTELHSNTGANCNTLIKTNDLDGTGNKNLLLGFNNDTFNVRGKARIYSQATTNSYVLMPNDSATADYGFELRKMVGTTSTPLVRIKDGSIFNLYNRGSLVLKDTNGKGWYLRVNTSGELVITET